MECIRERAAATEASRGRTSSSPAGTPRGRGPRWRRTSQDSKITRGKLHRLSGNLGGVYELTCGTPAVQQNALQNIWVTVKMHGITRIVLANHTDCAKYGVNGHPNDLEFHIEQVRTAGGILLAQQLHVELFGLICVRFPDQSGYDPDLHVVFEPRGVEELLGYTAA